MSQLRIHHTMSQVENMLHLTCPDDGRSCVGHEVAQVREYVPIQHSLCLVVSPSHNVAQRTQGRQLQSSTLTFSCEDKGDIYSPPLCSQGGLAEGQGQE